MRKFKDALAYNEETLPEVARDERFDAFIKIAKKSKLPSMNPLRSIVVYSHHSPFAVAESALLYAAEEGMSVVVRVELSTPTAHFARRIPRKLVHGVSVTPDAIASSPAVIEGLDPKVYYSTHHTNAWAEKCNVSLFGFKMRKFSSLYIRLFESFNKGINVRHLSTDFGEYEFIPIGNVLGQFTYGYLLDKINRLTCDRTSLTDESHKALLTFLVELRTLHSESPKSHLCQSFEPNHKNYFSKESHDSLLESIESSSVLNDDAKDLLAIVNLLLHATISPETDHAHVLADTLDTLEARLMCRIQEDERKTQTVKEVCYHHELSMFHTRTPKKIRNQTCILLTWFAGLACMMSMLSINQFSFLPIEDVDTRIRVASATMLLTMLLAVGLIYQQNDPIPKLEKPSSPRPD